MTYELSLYKENIQKLEKFCQENGMEYEIFHHHYPLMMRVHPTGGYMQLSVLDEPDTPNPNAKLQFTLEDGEIHFKIDDGFSIGEGAFNKLKGFFQKIASFYLQFFFRVAMTSPDLAREAAEIQRAADEEEAGG